MMMRRREVHSSKRARSPASLTWAALGLWAFAFAALAQQEGDGETRQAYLGAGAIVERTDNVTRSAVDELSDTVVGAVTDFGWSQDSERLAAELQGNLAYYDYTSDVYDTEVVGSALGRFDIQISPDRFSWMLEDAFGQARVDELAPVTPDNRQNVNVFSTGPRFNFRLGARNNASLEANYSDTNYGVSAEDNDSTILRLSLGRQVGRRVTLSLNGTTESVDYTDQALFPDYDEDEFFIGAQVTGARTSLSADVGRSTVRGFGGEDNESDGDLVRLEIEREIAATGSLALRVRKETSSSSNAFRLSRQLLGASAPIELTVIAADPFDLEYTALSYTVENPRIALAFDIGAQEERYAFSLDQNRDAEWFALSFASRLGATWTTGVFAQLGRETYVDRTDARFDRRGSGVILGINFTDSLRLDVTIARDERDATFATGGYAENYVTLVIAHWMGGREPPRITSPRSR
jgi:hypothetical protein